MQALTIPAYVPVVEPNLDRSETLTDFVYDSLIQLAPAIDYTIRLLQVNGMKVHSLVTSQGLRGMDLLAYDLECVGVSFAYADRNVAREESLLLSELAHLMKPLVTIPFVKLNFAAFRDVKEHNDWFIPLICLELIREYDTIFDTSQTETLRSLYYRFAEEMVEADRQIAPEESARLNELRSLLYQYAEDGIVSSQNSHHNPSPMTGCEMPLHQTIADEHLLTTVSHHPQSPPDHQYWPPVQS
jgi:hypothetical protein